MNYPCVHCWGDPASSTLGPADRTSLCTCQLLHDAECETFNQVFQGQVTSGNNYPDVANHFGWQLLNCCPGDECRTYPSPHAEDVREGPELGRS